MAWWRAKYPRGKRTFNALEAALSATLYVVAGYGAGIGNPVVAGIGMIYGFMFMMFLIGGVEY